MVALQPFEGAANRTAVGIFGKGHAVQYPVNYTYWKKKGRGRGSAVGFDTPYSTAFEEKIVGRQWQAEPVNPRDLNSAWITGRAKAIASIRRVIGPSEYKARIGVYTGGANGVYWVEALAERPPNLLMVANVTEGAKKKVARTQGAVEAELVYPLLRGRDVSRWIAEPSLSILLTHEKGEKLNAIPTAAMQRRFPRAYSYLRKYEGFLQNRAVLKRYFGDDAPFYSMFDIGDYTFRQWKVVWREQADSLTAAVVGCVGHKPVVPDHKLMMVAADSEKEAYFLCALLNSSLSRFVVASYAVETQMNAHILRNIAVPRYSNAAKLHTELANLSKDAHRAAKSGRHEDIDRIEEEIDRCVASLWGVNRDELAEVRRSLVEV
jgi:hypothetical protein